MDPDMKLVIVIYTVRDWGTSSTVDVSNLSDPHHAFNDLFYLCRTCLV
jgi:hypothetical protein